MKKQKLRDSLYFHVRLSPVARCKIPGGPWLPKIDRDWFVARWDDRIHHFEYEPHRDGNGNKHGMYILRTQLAIHGNEIHYLPLTPGPVQPARPTA